MLNSSTIVALAGNGSRIGDVANFEKQIFNLKINLI